MQTGNLLPLPAEQAFYKNDIQLLICRREKLSPENWRFRLNSPFWRLYVVDSCGSLITSQNLDYKLTPEEVTLIPAWIPFDTQTRTLCTQDFIHFEFSGLTPLIHRERFPTPIFLPFDSTLRSLHCAWIEAMHRSEQDSNAYLHWASAFLHAVLANFLAKHPGGSDQLSLASSSAILPALKKMEERLDRINRNDELAALCHLGPDHFIRKFKASTGLTPAQYSLDRRLAEGARLLTQSQESLEWIAGQTGFSDRFHFSKAFKTRFETTPAAYRRSHQSSLSG